LTSKCLQGGISIDTFTLTAKNKKFFTHARHMAEAGGDHLVADYCNAADRSAVKVGHFCHMAGMSKELFVLGGERKGVD
jgi:hypothetical protein